MAKEPKTYVVLEDFDAIARRIVDQYQELFAGLDPALVRCYAVENKPSDANTKLFVVRPVVMPIRIDVPFAWYAEIYLSDWNDMDNAHKHDLVARILYACTTDEGKVRKYDYQDFGVFLDAVGPHASERDDLVDILEEHVKFRAS